MKDIHLLLPEDVYERIEAEAEKKLMKVMHLARLCVLDRYGGVSVVSGDYTNHGIIPETVQQESGNDNS